MPNAGDVVRASDRDTPIRALLRQTSAQTITTGTWTSITMDTEDVDDDAAHSTSSNTSRYTFARTGWFLVAWLVTFANNNTGARGARLAVNGSALAASQYLAQTPATTANPGIGGARLVQCTTVGDYVEVQGFHQVGANLNTQASADGASNMSVVFIGA